jgi:hypothetical protein
MGLVTTGVVAFLLWVALFIWLGLRTLRHGHWVMFLVGISCRSSGSLGR